MPDLTAFIKENPAVAGSLILGVAVLAYLSSRNGGSSTVSDAQFRGNVAAGIDPNAAAIEQAAINAGSANLQTIASLAGLQDSNANALSGSLAQTSAEREVSLSGISANLRASLASTEAQREESLASTQAGVDINSSNNATSLQAANITDAYNRTSLAAQQSMYSQQQETERFQIQAGKDEVRAKVNGGIVDGLVHLGTALLGFL